MFLAIELDFNDRRLPTCCKILTPKKLVFIVPVQLKQNRNKTVFLSAVTHLKQNPKTKKR